MSKEIKTGKRFQDIGIIDVVLGFALLALLILPLFSTPKLDDFERMAYADRLGFWNYVWWQYLSWEGRFLGLADIVKNFLFYALYDVRPINFLWTVALFLTGYSTALYFRNISKTALDKKNLILLSGFLTVVIWLALFPTLKYNYYWATCSYSVNLLAFVFLAAYLEGVKKSGVFDRKLLIVLAAVVVGNGIYYVSVPFLVYWLIWLWEVRRKKDLHRKFSYYLTRSLLLIVLPVVAGTSYTALSPGSHMRAVKAGMQIILSPYHLVLNTLNLFDQFLVVFGKFILIAGLLIALIVKTMGLSFDRKQLLGFALKWFFVGFLSLEAFAPMSFERQVIRVGYIWAVGWSLALGLILTLFLPQKIKKYKTLVLFPLAAAFAIITNYALAGQIRFYYTQFLPREKTVLEHRFHPVDLCPYNLKAAPLELETLSANPDYWGNKLFARFYSLEDVRLRKTGCSYQKVYVKTHSGWYYKHYKKLQRIFKQPDR